ncbi:LuxR C-terminal-related transcriptional regulator [Streptomyces platensis]|uniref:LuxR C-terminal-related transcriptional regulator n=1 Tax=Streptomyces platensis TaxID=58346 RepID=UPI003C2FBDFA
MGNNGITVLLVDDQTLLRETLCHALAAQSDIEVIGGVTNDEMAIHVAAKTKPDVILLDGAEPCEIISRIAGLRQVSPESHCIVLTSLHHPALIEHALRLQVSGFLTKSLNREEVVSAIRSVSRHPDQMLLAVPKESLAAVLRASQVRLSSRELQIMEKVALGLSNGQIASRLAITESTVKRHLRNVFEKLGAVSRIDAVNKAKSMLVLGSTASVNGNGQANDNGSREKGGVNAASRGVGKGRGSVPGAARANGHEAVVPYRAPLGVMAGS